MKSLWILIMLLRCILPCILYIHIHYTDIYNIHSMYKLTAIHKAISFKGCYCLLIIMKTRDPLDKFKWNYKWLFLILFFVLFKLNDLLMRVFFQIMSSLLQKSLILDRMKKHFLWYCKCKTKKNLWFFNYEKTNVI